MTPMHSPRIDVAAALGEVGLPEPVAARAVLEDAGGSSI